MTSDRSPVEPTTGAPVDIGTSHPAVRGLIGLSTVGAIALVVASYQDRWLSMVLLSGLVAVLGVLSVIDVAEQRLPNKITHPLAGATVLIVAAAGLGQDEIVRGLVALGIGLSFATVLLLFRFGMGDVKLALSIGAATGWLGATALSTMLLVSTGAFSLAGVVLMLVHRERKLAFGFGPFLALGTAVGILAAA